VPVDPGRHHIRGPAEAKVTVVEYGDFECPYCGQAEPVVRALLANFGDLRYVWRHLPLTDVHPNAAPSAVSGGGTFTAIDFPWGDQDGGRRDQCAGDIVGGWSDATGTQGFLLQAGVFTSINFPLATSTTAFGLNDPGRSPALQVRRWQQPRLHLPRRRL
jgi:Thioredoxin